MEIRSPVVMNECLLSVYSCGNWQRKWFWIFGNSIMQIKCSNYEHPNLHSKPPSFDFPDLQFWKSMFQLCIFNIISIYGFPCTDFWDPHIQFLDKCLHPYQIIGYDHLPMPRLHRRFTKTAAGINVWVSNYIPLESLNALTHSMV